MYVHVPTPPPVSKEARELSEYLGRVIQAYQEDHPELTKDQVQQALRLATTQDTSMRAPLVLALGFGAVALFAVLGYVAEAGQTGRVNWLIPGIVAASVVLAVVAALRSAKRRGG